jgi:hypothetical protein
VVPLHPASVLGPLGNGTDITNGLSGRAEGSGGDTRDGLDRGFKSVVYKTALPQEIPEDSDEIEFTMADAQRGRSLFIFGPDSKIRFVFAHVR